MPVRDRIIAFNPVLVRRLARNWSQGQLAERVGISRAAVSAIEGERLSPSVATALALAGVFECTVEELFGQSQMPTPRRWEWAWTPRGKSSRYWEAAMGPRPLLYPVEAVSLNLVPHDGIWTEGICRERASQPAPMTLVVATCDPAAGLLAAEYARATGLRLLAFPRSGAAALELLRQGLVHVAALHRSTSKTPGRNAATVRERLGEGFQLLRAAEWEEGVACSPDNSSRLVGSVTRHTKRWAAREEGSGARECLNELLKGRPFNGREVCGHASVAEAVRSGWADAGVCVRFSAEEAGLKFLPVRKESLDFCFSAQSQHDPRIQALIGLLRTRAYCRLLSELPGYDARHTGEIRAV
jgi:molybdate-binding protein/DNA-binding XRE family transcriptional regulator